MFLSSPHKDAYEMSFDIGKKNDQYSTLVEIVFKPPGRQQMLSEKNVFMQMLHTF